MVYRPDLPDDAMVVRGTAYYRRPDGTDFAYDFAFYDDPSLSHTNRYLMNIAKEQKLRFMNMKLTTTERLWNEHDMKQLYYTVQ
jgi:hypothetical protein